MLRLLQPARGWLGPRLPQQHWSAANFRRHNNSLLAGIVLPPAVPLLPVSTTTEKTNSPAAASSLASESSDSPVEEPVRRTPEEQAALVATLMRTTSTDPPSAAAAMEPPADSCDWSPRLLGRWFTDGGNLTVAALDAEPSSASTRRLIDRVGEALPVVELQLLDLDATVCGGGGGLLGALRRSDSTACTAIADALAERDCVACCLGAGEDPALVELANEGERAWPQMRMGEIRSAADGTIVAGRSPSDALRGDRYLLSRELTTLAEEARHALGCGWPAIAAADEALGTITSMLAPALAATPKLGLELDRRSDTFFARFLGDGLGYGSHFDGAGDERCRITCILYTNRDWRPEDGGCLQLLDEKRRCWWSLPPRVDTLVFFRSDRVLHRVEPCHVPRVALTVFLSAKRTAIELKQLTLASQLARLSFDF
jgi:hypothetical protein